MRLLLVGDVFGRPGRSLLQRRLPAIIEEQGVDLTIANAENAAGGTGLTRETADEVLDAGVDLMTMGNHTFAKREILSFIDREPRLIRPLNYPPGAPGRGWTVVTSRSGVEVGVINAMGRVFATAHLDDPFRGVDAALAAMPETVRVRVVDFHAEATAEKMAMGLYLDGRVSVVAGTHTHVQTADARVLPGGTAFVTDLGMTGPRDSIIGVKPELALSRFLTQMPVRFQPAEGPALLSAALVDVDAESGRATGIEAFVEGLGARQRG